MTYREIKKIGKGLLEADRLAIRKLETVDALDNIDQIEITDDDIDVVCDAIQTQYDDFLSSKYGNCDIYDFTYGINACIEHMEIAGASPLTVLMELDWGWVFQFVSEMD